MKLPIINHLLSVIAILASISTSATATVIFTEDWQDPDITDTRLEATNNGGFTGWEFEGNNVFFLRNSPSNGIPQAGLPSNQAVQFEWSDAFASYDTTHNWASDDQFSVSFNATEMNWSNASDRFVRVRISETVGGARLWQGDVQLAQYDTNHDGNGEDWAAFQFYTMNFSTTDFGTVLNTVAGTEGSALTFEIGGTRRDLVDNSFYANEGRGSYVDNITFSVIPEPASVVLAGLAGFGLAFRRRR